MPEYLKILHGSYNAAIVILFFYQARLGLSIRHARRSGARRPFSTVNRHMRNGPIFALGGGLGFLWGLVLALLDKGRVLLYPAHLFVGLTIVLLLTSTFLVSRQIKGLTSPFRTPHFILGLCILLLYVVQVFLGLGALL